MVIVWKKRPEYIETKRERGATARIIELNVAELERALCMRERWRRAADGLGSEATITYYVTDTGHVCHVDDPHVFIQCVSTFSARGDAVTHENTDVYTLPGAAGQDSPEVWNIIGQTLKIAAEQMEEFPRLIPGTPIGPLRK